MYYQAEWRLQVCSQIGQAAEKPNGGQQIVDVHKAMTRILLCRCCVQRIAQRSGVLSQERRALLDALGFDWTGADALS